MEERLRCAFDQLGTEHYIPWEAAKCREENTKQLNWAQKCKNISNKIYDQSLEQIEILKIRWKLSRKKKKQNKSIVELERYGIER